MRRQTTPGPGGLIDKGTKVKRARTVPLIEEVRPLVEKRLESADSNPMARLFTGPRGGRITTAVLRDATHWDEVVHPHNSMRDTTTREAPDLLQRLAALGHDRVVAVLVPERQPRDRPPAGRLTPRHRNDRSVPGHAVAGRMAVHTVCGGYKELNQ